VSGRPGESNDVFVASDGEDIKKVRASGRLARKMLDFACSVAKPGMTTEEVDILCHNEIIRHGAYPSPINYYGFPKAICTSVNDVVCHGIPDDRKLEEGDVLSIDVSIFKDGFHGDNCGTIIVGSGKGDPNAERLVHLTRYACETGVSICKPGV
jgi:methionyl aminopeptidase